MKKNIALTVCLIAILVCGCTIPNIAGAYQEAEPVYRSTAKQSEKTEKTVPTETATRSKTDDNTQTKPSVVVASAFAAAQATPEKSISESVKSRPGFVPQLPPEEAATPKTEQLKKEENVRSEAFTVVDAEKSEPLKTYHVVIGSFKKQSNAKGLQEKMRPQYAPVIVRNTQGMYRVLLASYDDFASAKRQCKAVRSQFYDVWILVGQK